MKAYVIKNKEGKYFKQCSDNESVDFTDNILSCELYAKRIGAESTRDFIFRNAYKFNIEDLETVEITIAEGDLEQEIKELKTRISELEDKDWYESCIKQLEEQNDKLIKERDEIQKELETSVDYWKNEVFKKIEVKLTGVTKEKIQEIRKQVCNEIREEAHNYMEIPICEKCAKGFYDSIITSYDLKAILNQIEGKANGK